MAGLGVSGSDREEDMLTDTASERGERTTEKMTYAMAKKKGRDVRLEWKALQMLPLYRPLLMQADSAVAAFEAASVREGSSNSPEDERSTALQLALPGTDGEATQKNESYIMQFVRNIELWATSGFYEDRTGSAEQVWNFFDKLSELVQGSSAVNMWTGGKGLPGMAAQPASHVWYSILQYHLLDRMAWIYNIPSASVALRAINRDAYKAACRDSTHFNKIVHALFDWKKLLDQLYESRPARAKEAQTRSTGLLKSAWNVAEWDNSAANSVIEALGSKTKRAESDKHWATAVANLERAAIAINLFYTGDIFLTREQLAKKHPSIIDSKGAKQFMKVLNPLVLALCLSPVALFCGISLKSNYITRIKYQEVCASLGNSARPEILERFEQATWVTVFLIARGSSADERLEQLLQYWMETCSGSLALDKEACQWFKEPCAPGTANITEHTDDQDNDDETESSSEADMDIDELNDEDIAVKVKVEKLVKNAKLSPVLKAFDFDFGRRSHRTALSSLMDEIMKDDGQMAPPTEATPRRSPVRPSTSQDAPTTATFRVIATSTPTTSAAAVTSSVIPAPATPLGQEAGPTTEAGPAQEVGLTQQTGPAPQVDPAQQPGPSQQASQNPEDVTGGGVIEADGTDLPAPAQSDTGRQLRSSTKKPTDAADEPEVDDVQDDSSKKKKSKKKKAEDDGPCPTIKIPPPLRIDRHLAAMTKLYSDFKRRRASQISAWDSEHIDKSPVTLDKERVKIPAYQPDVKKIVEIPVRAIITEDDDGFQKKFLKNIRRALVQSGDQMLDTDNSGIIVMTEEDLKSLTRQEVQATFAMQNILVTEVTTPSTEWAWDAESMGRLGSLQELFTLRDLGLPHSGTATERARLGTLNDILLAGEPAKELPTYIAWHSDKVLCCVNKTCPVHLVELVSLSNFTSHERVLAHNGDIYNSGNDRDWLRGLSWMGVGNACTPYDMGVYTDGLCTVMRPLVGRRLVVVFTPLNEISEVVDNFHSWEPFSGEWDDLQVEAIVLGVNETLYLRPNTICWSYDLDNTIVYGRHFYAEGCLSESVYGMVHTQFGGTLNMELNLPLPLPRVLLADFITFWNHNLLKGQIDNMFDRYPDLAQSVDLRNFIQVFNAAVFSTTLSPEDGSPTDTQYAAKCIQRTDRLIACLSLLEHYVSLGYGTIAGKRWDDRYEFFRQGNLRFAKALVTYSTIVSDDPDLKANMPVQTVFLRCRTDLGQLWGHDSQIVKDLDAFAANIDDEQCIDMYGSHIEWVSDPQPRNSIPRPAVPLASLLPTRKRTRVVPQASPNTRAKRARTRAQQASPIPQEDDEEAPAPEIPDISPSPTQASVESEDSDSGDSEEH
ncbi:hypothetical protein DENSPDRAFT_846338 [Dentipellis sp. KUC8613]|nr:hypothetical protein DENSPDRAFT_846338 [Dentipellis sp. KUC8613]